MGLAIATGEDPYSPDWVIWCNRCKHEGRRWVLPHDCPHEWISAADRIDQLIASLRARFRPK